MRNIGEPQVRLLLPISKMSKCFQLLHPWVAQYLELMLFVVCRGAPLDLHTAGLIRSRDSAHVTIGGP